MITKYFCRATLTVFTAGLLLIFSSVPLSAQTLAKDSKTPENLEIINEDINLQEMQKFMSKSMEIMFNAMLDVMAKPETAEKLAVFVRHYYDALIKQGFSEEQAMQIVTSVSIPLSSK